jgi:hypothetical protein
MSRITINDKEYETDTFNEEQVKLFNEAQFVTTELDRIAYVGKMLDAQRSVLVKALLDSLGDASEPVVT